MVHGSIVVMAAKQDLKTKELVDDKGRRFKIRKNHKYYEILNDKPLGLFSKAKEYLGAGVKYFYIDAMEDDVKIILAAYRKILDNERFDDKNIKKRYTAGHFIRGVS